MSLARSPAGAPTDARQGEGSTSQTAAPAPVQAHALRQPVRADGAAIHALIQACPPLDLNSVYAYLLLCEHHAGTCVLAERDGALEGFISAYVPPGRDDTLFVWQVAVHAQARGHGLGGRMLAHLLARPGLAGVRYVETTVGPDNQASRRMFAGLAGRLDTSVSVSPLFPASLFGGQGHEDEELLRIGPFDVSSAAGRRDRG